MTFKNQLEYPTTAATAAIECICLTGPKSRGSHSFPSLQHHHGSETWCNLLSWPSGFSSCVCQSVNAYNSRSTTTATSSRREQKSFSLIRWNDVGRSCVRAFVYNTKIVFQLISWNKKNLRWKMHLTKRIFSVACCCCCCCCCGVLVLECNRARPPLVSLIVITEEHIEMQATK